MKLEVESCVKVKNAWNYTPTTRIFTQSKGKSHEEITPVCLSVTSVNE